MKHVVGNLLGSSSSSSGGGNGGVSPTAEPAPTSNPTVPSNAPTATGSSSSEEPPPSNPTSAPTSSPPVGPGGETSSSSSSTSSVASGHEDGATTDGSTPSATGTVQPNPVALPHDPSGDDSTDSPSESQHGSSGTNTGTGTGANGGNAPGGTLPDGDDKKLSTGAVTGIAIVSAFVGLAVVMCLVRFYFIRRRRSKRHEWAQRSTMMIQAHVNAVTTPAPRLSSDSGDVESGRPPRESYHSGSSFGGRAPVRESYHSDDGPATVESFQSGAVSVGSTNESHLFTGPPPMPSWSRASRTQQRRILCQDGESSSAENENFGTIIPDSRIAWTAPRSSPPVLPEPHLAPAGGVYQTQHTNTHLMDDAISLSETSSGCITVESGSSFAAGSSVSQGASTDSVDVHESGLLYARSPSPQELPARGSTHLSGEFSTNWLGGSSPASSPTPTSTTFSASSSTTPLMSQLSYRPAMLSAPMAVPLHMIVPSQSPPPPSMPLPVPPHMIVPSQLPPPQEPRTLSVVFAQADPFASPHDKPQRA